MHNGALAAGACKLLKSLLSLKITAVPYKLLNVIFKLMTTLLNITQDRMRVVCSFIFAVHVFICFDIACVVR